MDTKPRWMQVLTAALNDRRSCIAALALFSAVAMTVVGLHLAPRSASTTTDNTAANGAPTHALSSRPQGPTASMPPVSGQLDGMAGYYDPLELFTVDITADGEQLTLYTAGDQTVADLLDYVGIVLGEHDEVSVAPDAKVDRDLAVKVCRVAYREYSEVQTVKYQAVTQYTHALGSGRKVLVQSGKDGSQKITYRVRIENGVEVGETVVAQEVITPVVDEITQIGTSTSVPVSTAPYDILLDENGQPLHYAQKMTGSSTAYSGPQGTATGQPARVGIVAVDPKVIPYGTELYIVSADGKFVYGYAIAGDTGGACRSGRILVDVFLDTEEACSRWGRRNINVYILK